MSTYQELKAQAEELLKKAEEVRAQEIQGAIADIRKKMADFGLTIRDIAPNAGSIGSGVRRASSSKGAKAKAKYQDQMGNSWSGRGKRPKWLVQALAGGRQIEEFRIG